MKIIIYGFILVLLFLSGCDENTDIGSKNTAPLAVDDVIQTFDGETKIIDILENDTDSDGNIDRSTVEIVTNVAQGETIIDPNTGKVTYTPTSAYTGEDHFIYRVKDDQGTWSNNARVNIVVVPNKKLSKAETKATNWYIRIVAEDTSRGMTTESSQLGELEESATVQTHTLKALAPFSSSYIDVVFIDPDGMDAGEYKTNFHLYQEDTEDRWQFTVKTDDSNADIVLTWRGLYVLTPYIDDQNRQRYKEYLSMTNPLIKNMKLVDSSNGNEIAAVVDGKVQIYSFNMEGQTERTFEWVVQTAEVTIPVALSNGKVQTYSAGVNGEAKTFKWNRQVDELIKPAETSKLSTLQAEAIQKDAVADKTKIIIKKAASFDLSKPPTIKEDMFGN